MNNIIIGDCVEELQSFKPNSFELVLTDIPYNISKKSNGLRKLDYGEWDKQYGKEKEWIDNIIRVVKGTAIVFCGKKQFSYIIKQFEEAGLSTRTMVWHKPNPTVLNCDKLYIEATELFVYAKKRKAFYKPKYKHNIFEYPIVHYTKRVHPNQKPLKLFKELIIDCSKENDIILDPFAGSGTTGLAAELTNRKFIGIELNPEYAEIAKKRTNI